MHWQSFHFLRSWTSMISLTEKGNVMLLRVWVAILVIVHGTSAYAADCYTLTPMACSTCGVATTCTSVPCTGFFNYRCPSNATQQYRLVSAGTTVPSCDLTQGPGKRECATGGNTLWCVGEQECADAGNLCPMPPGGGPRFCASGAGAFLHNVCGLAPAQLGGAYCNY